MSVTSTMQPVVSKLASAPLQPADAVQTPSEVEVPVTLCRISSTLPVTMHAAQLASHLPAAVSAFGEGAAIPCPTDDAQLRIRIT
mmetsp:Transcript_46944/g.82760  ORF Transcript_46944/g.82760 Transcript_46944/m.82760 type:complete len:85 (+) Transcript_46944:585-839(+)